VPAHVRYKPNSTAIPAGSCEYYLDGVRWRIAGARGSISLEAQAGGAVKATCRLRGLFVSKTDAAVPSVTYDGTRPGTFRDSVMSMNRARVALQTLSLDTAMDMPFPANPNAAEGFDPPEAVRRTLTGRANPFLSLVATRDAFAAFRAGTEEIIHARVLGGLAANPGQRLGITVPAAFYTGVQPADQQGLATEDIAFFCRGQDSGAFLAFY
jgi:hypothetical protein